MDGSSKATWREHISKHFNFYRTHLLFFTVIPLLASLVFYWLNDARSDNEQFVSFVDSLFLCLSAGTVTGLYTVVLSSLEVGQQIILALLTAVGSYSFVSTVMVIIRRYYFAKEMRTLLERRATLQRELSGHGAQGVVDGEKLQLPGKQNGGASRSQNGLVGEAVGNSLMSDHGSTSREKSRTSVTAETRQARSEDGPTSQASLRQRSTIAQKPQGVKMRRTDTVATRMDRGYGGFPSLTVTLRKLALRLLGGRVYNKFGLHKKLEIPHTLTLQSVHIPHPSATHDPMTKVVPYLTFDAVVGKNSAFNDLSDEELEELGGVELRALNLLSWAVPAYWFGVQLLGFTIIAPYMARAQFRDGLTTEDGQAAAVNSTWFSLFQVISAYANNGILVDASLVPFQNAYLLLWGMIILILAGNTAFPVFLRFFLWLGSMLVRKHSQTYATLRFLLDHPRRCFLYLFPSTQTWYLAAVVISLNVVDWILFLLLDIGNSPISSIPSGVRVMAGLFQAVAVRCGGFQIVALGSLAPAVQVLYVVMMYVGALPLALGVRSTNVYEDRSIALYEEDVDSDEPEPAVHLHPGAGKAQVWGEYIAWHLKRQLSFDIWWLALAIFLICVFERGKLLDSTKSGYLNVFSIIFEVVSGYGTVGLSLGVPNVNYSLSGALGTASKLVLCAVMLRGRHRGLPAAIDRSVLLPGELGRQTEMESMFRQRRDLLRQALHSAMTDEKISHEGDEEIPPGMA